ncbi:MAG: PmoA family protein [Opitutaceae bacterium]|nr:PmoA family protein [Opitutaceae bacterium]
MPEKFKRSGYLHPVVSPSGSSVTGDYPSNHVHHHGIWTSWSRTGFQGRNPNFWEMGEQTGTVESVTIDRSWSGPVHGGFVSRHRMVDLSAPAATTAINETWELTAYDLPASSVPVRLFDLVVTQSCATSDPVMLRKHHYGGLGFRGPDAWDGKDRLVLLTSEGETRRDRANASRVRWCYLGESRAIGAAAGILILGSPENFRAPQPIRVHPTMPFFSFAPSALGDFEITPVKPLVMRYRFIVSDGPPDQNRMEAWWNGYTVQAEVSITTP